MGFERKKSKKTKEEKALQRQRRKLRRWEFTKYFLSVLNTVAALASISGVIISVATDEIKNMVIYITLAIVLILALVTLLVIRRSRKQDKMEEVKKYAKGFHEISHLIRDCHMDFEEVVFDNTYSKSQHFRKYVTEKVMKMMDVLSSNLTTATGCKVRACIKICDFTNPKDDDKDNLQLITLARSGKSNVNNMISEHYTKIAVNDNTDFEYVFNIKEGYEEECKHFFVADDLSQIEDYKNSNKKWEKAYATTIVMPIRCLINPSEDEHSEPHYDIIGCLCIDSKKKNLFALDNRGFVLEYLKGVADMLYIYLDECILYHGYLKKEFNDD